MQGKVMTDDAVSPVYVGIDVCKERLEIYILPSGERLEVANDASGRSKLVRRLQSLSIKLVVIEPTSKYHRAVHRHLHSVGIDVALINPLRARLFAEAWGQLAKTDRIDARMLALIAERMAPDAVAPASEAVEELQELANAREGAIAERIAVENRLATAVTPFLRRELKARLRSLKGHVDRLDMAIAGKIAADPVIARIATIVKSIPGVGPIAALNLITELDEIGRLTGKQAAALAGLAPFARESGPWKGQSYIRGGRFRLRKALYMAALVASRYNPDMKTFYERLRAKGKPAKAALAAVARKLVVLANTLVAQDRCWNQAQPAISR
jgi:transposase